MRRPECGDRNSTLFPVPRAAGNLLLHMTKRHDSEQEPKERAARALELFHQRIGAAGLKSTRQRDAIVELFFQLYQHISVEELHNLVKSENPRIGYATVYRTLKVLVELAEHTEGGDALAQRIRQRIRDKLVVTTDIHLVPWGSLPRSEYKSKLIDYSEAADPEA